MIVINPLEVTASNLTSNVAISETLWTAGTYNTGVQRYEGTDLYEVVATPSTTDQPGVGAAKAVPTWIKIGKINRFKMFDGSLGQATSRTSPIEVTIAPGITTNAVAIFEIEGGDTVQVEVDDPVDGTVYDETITLVDNSNINDVYDYFFEPIVKAREALFLDLPNFPSADITVTITGPTTVEVGELVVGARASLGVTTQDVSIGIEDFTRRERDEFGQWQIIERSYARLMNAVVYVPSRNQDAVLRRLANLRATPAVYIGGENFPETYLYGFFRDFTIARTGPDTAEMNIEIEGVI